jgi:hypothetical protein
MDEDDKPGATAVAVLSHRYWQQRLEVIVGSLANKSTSTT